MALTGHQKLRQLCVRETLISARQLTDSLKAMGAVCSSYAPTGVVPVQLAIMLIGAVLYVCFGFCRGKGNSNLVRSQIEAGPISQGDDPGDRRSLGGSARIHCGTLIDFSVNFAQEMAGLAEKLKATDAGVARSADAERAAGNRKSCPCSTNPDGY